MSRRLVPVVVAAALVAAGCNSQLGRSVPSCDPDTISNTLILEAQAVRGAAYVPCIEDLRPGWDYEDLTARSGEARFWLDSDRVGHRFLEVVFAESCDTSGAVEADSDEPAIPRFVDDEDVDYYLDVVVIPEGDDDDLRIYADEIAHTIGAGRVEDRLVRSFVNATPSMTSDRIDSALSGGAAALVVGDREYEERRVEVHLRKGNGEMEVIPGLTPEHALDEIAEYLGKPTYRSTWYYPFEGACVTYRFEAEGPGVERIARDVEDALGFLDLAPIRAYGEQLGYVLP